MTGSAPAEPAGSLDLRRLTKRYGEVTAVHDLSLSIRPGEFFTLLGPSGSGKTTTLMIIAGFVDADEGAIFLDGRSVERVPPERRNLGVVFQNYALFPHMTVWDNIAFPLEARRLPTADIKRRVHGVLDLVQLTRQGAAYPGQLSGGQQQRVALARALVFEPSVLLMDEPLGALDKALRTHLQGELKALQRHLGVTVVYVTHDQEEALTMSDRLAVMHQGRIEQVGAPRQIYNEPATLFVARFLGDSNILAGSVAAHRGDRTDVRLDGTHTIVCGPCDVPAGGAVMLVLRPERLSLEPVSDGHAPDIIGVIDEVTFAGDVTKHWVRLTAQTRVLVKVQNAERGMRFSPGEHVRVAYRPESIRVFPVAQRA